MYMPFYQLCSFGSILKHFWSTFQSHFSNDHAFLLTMQLWIYAEAFLKHFSITSLQRRTCIRLSINYAALDLFWSISEALFNHITAKKDMYRPFYRPCIFGSILKNFWSTFQSCLWKEGHVHAFLLTMQLWIYSEAFLKHFSITSLQRRTCTGFSINYATLDQFWSISEALFNHVSAKKDMYMPFY
jgi:hypothetical protein